MEYDPSMPSLMDLPDDCLEQILLRLPLKTVIGMEVICKRMWTLCQERYARIRRIRYPDFDNRSEEFTYENILGLSHAIANRCTNLREFIFYYKSPIFGAELKVLTPILKQLTSIEIQRYVQQLTEHGYLPEVLNWIWEEATENLEELICRLPFNPFYSAIYFPRLIKAHPNLKRFAVSVDFPFNLLPANLEELACINLHTDSRVTPLAYVQAKLKALTIESFSFEDPAKLKVPWIESVSVDSAYIPFSSYIERIPNLKSLAIGSPFNINYGHLSALFNFPTNLEFIICRTPTDCPYSTVLKLLDTYPRLKKLYFHFIHTPYTPYGSELVQRLRKRLHKQPRPHCTPFILGVYWYENDWTEEEDGILRVVKVSDKEFNFTFFGTT